MFLLWIVYLAAAGAIILFARLFGRWIPAPSAALLLLPPIAFCLPGFVGGRTLFPVDHMRLFPPWSEASAATPRNPNLNDVVTQIAPWWEAVRLCWEEGSLPLRNRWNGCGSALAANGQSGGFSPLSLLLIVLPLPQAFTELAAVKLLLAVTGMGLWLRRLGVSAVASFFGAISYSFSMTMMPWILFPLSGTHCLWPWAFWLVELLEDVELRRRAFVGLTVVIILWLLAGHAEAAVLGALGMGIYALVRALARDPAINSGARQRILGAGLIAIALTAFLWVPELLAIRASNRYPQAQLFRANLPVMWTPHFPAWRHGLATSLFPRALGDDITSPHIDGVAGSYSEMALGYFGIVGSALALLIVRPGSARSRAEIALFVLLLCGLAVGTAAWPLFDLFLSLPLVRLLLPLRFLSWVALAGSGVAAFEMDRLLKDRGSRRPRDAIFLFGVPALLVAIDVAVYRGFRSLHAASGGLASQRTALLLSVGALVATAALLALAWGDTRLAPAAPMLLVLLAGAELFRQGERLYRWTGAAEAFPPTPLVAYLRSQKPPFRVVGDGGALFPGTNIFAGVEDVRTHDPVERLDYIQFLNRVCGYDPNSYFKHIRDLDSPVLDFLNARFLVTGDAGRAETSRWRRVYAGSDGVVFENRRVLPRVFAPRRIRIFRRDEAAATPLPGADWGAEATVSDPLERITGTTSVLSNVAVDVSDYRETANRVQFTTRPEGEGRAILVTSLLQDGGWSATDEHGLPVSTVKANGIFLGLLLASGRHVIRLDYAPPGLREGAIVSAASLAVILGFAALRRMRNHSVVSRTSA